MILICKECGQEFVGKKSRQFCCKSHAASYTNRNRVLSEETKQKISNSHKKLYNENNYSQPTKWLYKDVKKYIEKEDYILLTTEYKSNKSNLKIQCKKCNDIFIRRFDMWLSGQRCANCYGNKRNTHDYVKEYIEKENYTLISEEYKNAISKLEIRCPKNHLFKMRFNNFQQGQRCPECDKTYRSSKAETEIQEYIRSIYNGEILTNDRSIITNPYTGWKLELDIFLSELRKAIEFNGDYWHSLDKSIKNDEIKKNMCRELGIELLIIKENEWKQNKELCMNNIRKFIYG